MSGNPPYSVSSSNKGEWIQNLIKDYKKDLNERKINLDDDYIKFIRYAEHFVEKNSTGIVAMITNNSFIDGVTHRQMRKHLLKTFDSIYILDLHGNSKKKEKAPDGSKDENVFDIQQGVSINIFVRKNIEKVGLGTVYHSELFGLRDSKFTKLNNLNIESINRQKLTYSEPYYFFVPKEFKQQLNYDNGFKIDELFIINSIGIATGNDNELVDFTPKILNQKYEDNITQYYYRPFDYRYTFYNNSILQRARKKIMDYYYEKNNFGLNIVRQSKLKGTEVLVSKIISNRDLITNHTYNCPLYIYDDQGNKKANFNEAILKKITNYIGEKTPEEIFDYIYAVLHSPSYRIKYKEFLKIDFPRIPYPENREIFDKLAKLGTKLRLLHLMEAAELNNFITNYPIAGTDTVEKVVYKDGNVFINSEQYFGKVTELAWNFYIGGYQPAQKWLKDRKGKTLDNSDIEHYQKIILALTETDRIMKQIDEVIQL